MRALRVDRTCRTRGVVWLGAAELLARCWVADRPIARLVGLLGTADLAPGEGLWLEPCRSVHTVGMPIPIACAFLDGDGRVLRIVDPLPPWRMARAAGARAVVETVAGGFATVRVGDRLTRDATGAGRLN